MTRKIFTRRDPARPRLASYLSAGRPARKKAGIWLTSVSTITLALVALASPSAMAATGYTLFLPGSAS